MLGLCFFSFSFFFWLKAQSFVRLNYIDFSYKSPYELGLACNSCIMENDVMQLSMLNVMWSCLSNLIMISKYWVLALIANTWLIS